MLFRRTNFVLQTLALCAGVASAGAASFFRDSLAVPAEKKFTVSLKEYPGINQINPRGWYHHVANVVLAQDGSLVACYRLADSHTLITSEIIIARSVDGGRTWTGHHSIAHADVWVEHAVWVAPQLSVLRDGRLVVICDLGERTTKDNSPMLTDWQKPDRGMSNYIFWSSDNGRTWTKGEKVDDVGGEPGFIIEQADGTLSYTRTSSQTTDQLKNPPAPWNNVYYRNEIVFSRDGGKTWGDPKWVADSPFFGDCEVGVVEQAPSKLAAFTRIGLGNGRFGHPSRIIYSDDGGKTWPRSVPAPFYGQRPHVAKLQSGKLLVTYRNQWGTPGSRAVVLDPAESLGFQPTSYILDESRCELTEDTLTLRTREGARSAVEFSFYPAQDDRARVEIETKLKVDEAGVNGVAISAGCWVRFETGRISLADRPAAGFAFDTRGWHTYRLIRQNGQITILADGVEKLREKIGDVWVREVRFGNRAVRRGAAAYTNNRAVSHWRKFSAKVTNDSRDYSIDWTWTPAKGYPDQFRRDRTVVLDYAYSADCGYSGWTQRPDGTIVILDYTNGGNLDSFTWGERGAGSAPFVRAYVVTEADLVRP